MKKLKYLIAILSLPFVLYLLIPKKKIWKHLVMNFDDNADRDVFVSVPFHGGVALYKNGEFVRKDYYDPHWGRIDYECSQGVVPFTVEMWGRKL